MSKKSWKTKLAFSTRRKELENGYPQGTRFIINHGKLRSRLPDESGQFRVTDAIYDIGLSIIQSCLITYSKIKPKFLNDPYQITPEVLDVKKHILFLPEYFSYSGIQAIGYSPNSNDLTSKFQIYTTKILDEESIYDVMFQVREYISEELQGMIHFNSYTESNKSNAHLVNVFDAFYLRDRHVYRSHILSYYLDSANAMINAINPLTQFEQILIDENGERIL